MHESNTDLSTPLSFGLSRVQRSSKKAVDPNPETNVGSSHSRPLSARRGREFVEAYTYGSVTSFARLAIDVDLALSNVHPPQSSPLKSHRGCTYAVSDVYPIIDVGQTGQKGRKVRRSASLQRRMMCTSASRMDIVRDCVDWRGWRGGCGGTAE